MVNGKDTSVVRIPGLTVGGALQLSNTSIIIASLAGVAISLAAMHFMEGSHRKEKWRGERFRNNPHAIKNKIFSDVVAFAADTNQVANNLPRIRAMVNTLNDRIKAQIAAYRSGAITQQQFDSTIRNMYPLILTELGIPPDTVPIHVQQQLDAKIDRIADKILEGQLPVKVKFRMYKNHPELAQLHALGRERALSVGQGHKYGLKRKMAMHTNAGVYLKEIGWNRPGFGGKAHHYAYGRFRE